MANAPVDQLLQAATGHHQAGRLVDAESIYRQILAAHPNHPEALYRLAVISGQTGQNEPGIDLMRQAIAASPNNPVYHRDLGVLLQNQGRLDETIACYQRAVTLKPDFAEAHYNFGIAWTLKGEIEKAIASYQRAAALRPEFADAHRQLGDLWKQTGCLGRAIACYQRAVNIDPKCAETLNKLGMVLDNSGDPDRAIACYQRALELVPNYAAAHNNLGSAWRGKGDLDTAIACYQRALEFDPGAAVIHNTLGRTWAMCGRYDLAIACYERALDLKSDYADPRYNIGHMRLLTGDFAAGWDLYELRWQSTGFEASRDFKQPLWTGSNHDSQTVLLTTEQGLGDTIQFIRYATLVADLRPRVLLECPPKLLTLLKDVPGIAQIIRRGEPLPPFDAYCPLMSLPRIFSTRLDSIPDRVPYLHADPKRSAAWSAQLAPDHRLKIGLAWAGSANHKHDRYRSMPLSAFAPLAKIPGTVFYSLQIGSAAEQAKSPPDGMNLIDRTSTLHDLADTAALIANLDLVISVDTAVAHLAGALAQPVWTLLAFEPDWRWLLNRSDSPWYPTMRLFRQPAIGDWATVLDQVASALRQALAERTSPR